MSLDIAAFHIRAPSPLPVVSTRSFLALARAALMRIDADLHAGRTCLLFSGHEPHSPAPSAGGWHAHVFLQVAVGRTGNLQRLYAIAPWMVDRSPPAQAWRAAQRSHFWRVVGRLRVLRGRSAAMEEMHMLPLTAESLREDDLFARARCWSSRTRYVPTRFPSRHDGADVTRFATQDVRRECRRLGLPEPRVRVLRTIRGRRGYVAFRLQLLFPDDVCGPLLLGRGMHHEGFGLFAPCPRRSGGRQPRAGGWRNS